MKIHAQFPRKRLFAKLFSAGIFGVNIFTTCAHAVYWHFSSRSKILHNLKNCPQMATQGRPVKFCPREEKLLNKTHVTYWAHSPPMKFLRLFSSKPTRRPCAQSHNLRNNPGPISKNHNPIIFKKCFSPKIGCKSQNLATPSSWYGQICRFYLELAVSSGRF